MHNFIINHNILILQLCKLLNLWKSEQKDDDYLVSNFCKSLEKRQRERNEKGLNLLIAKLKESLRKGKYLSLTFMILQFGLVFKLISRFDDMRIKDMYIYLQSNLKLNKKKTQLYVL